MNQPRDRPLSKALETLNNALDTIQSVPEILREAREYAREANDRVKAAERWPYIVERDKRIAELEIENRKLLEANHGLVTERDLANREISKLCRKITSLETDVGELRAKSEPVASCIGEPDYGDNWERCEKGYATEACYCTDDCLGGSWGPWQELVVFSFDCEPSHYRFRRPISKPAVESEPQWVACTAEEASKKADKCQWLDNNGDWIRLCDVEHGRFRTDVAYRTTANISAWVITKCENVGHLCVIKTDPSHESPKTEKVLRSTIPVGTVLG